MMSLAAPILALAGFAALALSMHKHHRDLFGGPPSRWRALALRSLGWMLLGLSCAACILESGWAVGPVLWLGVLTGAALMAVLTLTYRPWSVPGRDYMTSRGSSSSARDKPRAVGASARPVAATCNASSPTTGPRRPASEGLCRKLDRRRRATSLAEGR